MNNRRQCLIDEKSDRNVQSTLTVKQQKGRTQWTVDDNSDLAREKTTMHNRRFRLLATRTTTDYRRGSGYNELPMITTRRCTACKARAKGRRTRIVTPVLTMSEKGPQRSFDDIGSYRKRTQRTMSGIVVAMSSQQSGLDDTWQPIRKQNEGKYFKRDSAVLARMGGL